MSRLRAKKKGKNKAVTVQETLEPTKGQSFTSAPPPAEKEKEEGELSEGDAEQSETAPAYDALSESGVSHSTSSRLGGAHDSLAFRQAFAQPPPPPPIPPPFLSLPTGNYDLAQAQWFMPYKPYPEGYQAPPPNEYGPAPFYSYYGQSASGPSRPTPSQGYVRGGKVFKNKLPDKRTRRVIRRQLRAQGIDPFNLPPGFVYPAPYSQTWTQKEKEEALKLVAELSAWGMSHHVLIKQGVNPKVVEICCTELGIPFEQNESSTPASESLPIRDDSPSDTPQQAAPKEKDQADSTALLRQAALESLRKKAIASKAAKARSAAVEKLLQQAEQLAKRSAKESKDDEALHGSTKEVPMALDGSDSDNSGIVEIAPPRKRTYKDVDATPSEETAAPMQRRRICYADTFTRLPEIPSGQVDMNAPVFNPLAKPFRPARFLPQQDCSKMIVQVSDDEEEEHQRNTQDIHSIYLSMTQDTNQQLSRKEQDIKSMLKRIRELEEKKAKSPVVLDPQLLAQREALLQEMRRKKPSESIHSPES